MNDPGLRGFQTLLATNRNFRRLWFGQIVSQAGDWINTIAASALLLKVTGSGTMIGYGLILRMLPGIVVSPFAGVLIDRFDRKRILIAADVARGLLVPCFLLARSADHLWLLYLLIVAQVSLSAFFEPAKSAIIPSICTGEELLSANALSSVTWSLMLALGSAAGGFIVDTFGLGTAFLLDASTFFVSAWFVYGIDVPRRKQIAPRPEPHVLRDLTIGIRYILREPSIRSLVLVKTGVGLASGMVLLLTVLGGRDFRIGTDTAAGMGMLFFARGLGTAIGPFVGRAISGYYEPEMRRLIGVAFVQAACFFVGFGLVPSLPIAVLLLVIGHIGTSINWVFSTVLLQLKVPDELRGRVFSAEMFFFTLVFCVVTRLTGYALDDLDMQPRVLAAISGGTLILPGLLYILGQRRRRPLAIESGSRADEV